jgi:hypothetical protein
MKATQLIKRLEELIAEHGDCDIFSEADWEEVGVVEHCPKGEHVAVDKPYFILQWARED